MQPCVVCHLLHAPGSCILHVGPIPAFCAQCGRHHVAGQRCRCRTCGRMHCATIACEEQQRAPVIEEVYEEAAFSRAPVTAFDAGSPSDVCPHCGALFFVGEAQYVNCCRQGSVVVHQPAVPSAIYSLITDSHVHMHIRQYNAALAMASVGYSGDTLNGGNAIAPGRPHVDGYGEFVRQH